MLIAIASVYFITNVYFLLSGVLHQRCLWRLSMFISCKGGICCKYIDILGGVPFNNCNNTSTYYIMDVVPVTVVMTL